MPETQHHCVLTQAYQALFGTLKGKRRVSGPKDLRMSLAKPETQPSAVSIAPTVRKKQWKQKLTNLVREEEASPKTRRGNQKQQPVLQQKSHKNRWGNRQKL